MTDTEIFGPDESYFQDGYVPPVEDEEEEYDEFEKVLRCTVVDVDGTLTEDEARAIAENNMPDELLGEFIFDEVQVIGQHTPEFVDIVQFMEQQYPATARLLVVKFTQVTEED